MTLFEVAQLNKRFGGLVVTDGVTLALDRGSRVALIGPNGAGKTTFVNLVTGQLAADSGRILLEGEDITHVSATQRVRRGLVRTFQITRLFLDMSPREHVGLAILQREGRAAELFSDYQTMEGVLREVADIFDLLGLSGVAQAKVGEIAYGQQRLLEVAIALALRPKVLLLDEPAAGVPHADTMLIERALARLPPELAVLMIDHDMDFVFRFAQRVVVLDAGKLIFDGTPQAATKDSAVRKAYLGSYGA
jgi:branched-chain amino acid transport system ATP-binding protein